MTAHPAQRVFDDAVILAKNIHQQAMAAARLAGSDRDRLQRAADAVYNGALVDAREALRSAPPPPRQGR
jgi:hypothetical protein